MLKANAVVISILLSETWSLIGRARKYPEEWRQGLLTPIFKKGERVLPQNYITFCMLSCTGKVIEAAIAELIARSLPIFGRHLGFQKGLSPTITLLDVDAIVKGVNNRIATLYLTKAYDNVNRSLLLQNCIEVLYGGTVAMLAACLTVLLVTTKGDVTGEVA